MKEIAQLVELSRRYGADSRYVIAGGGNTSFKTGERLWVKASGLALADITEDGFAVMDRARLAAMGRKDYSADSALREREVKDDLAAACLTPGRRPSVETSLHDLLDAPFVVHLHPTAVCAMMSTARAGDLTGELFGAEALYVPYTDPGYTLFRRVDEGVAGYRRLHGAEPRLIFLQNHGIFVSGGSPEAIADAYDRVLETIAGRITDPVPEGDDGTASEHTADVAASIGAMLGGKTVRAFRSALIDHFAKSPVSFEDVSRPFTPDNIVYCKSHYLYSESDSPEAMRTLPDDYRARYGYYPKVMVVKGVGLITCGDSAAEADTAAEVYSDMMRVAHMARSLGELHPMEPAWIDFIDNWEVENYRRQVRT